MTTNEGTTAMDTDLKDLAERIRGLREACDVSVEDMAANLGVPLDTYERTMCPSRPSIIWRACSTWT